MPQDEITTKLGVDLGNSVQNIDTVTAAEARLTTAIELSAGVADATTKSSVTRAQALAELRERLVAQQSMEDKFLQTLIAGKNATEEDHKAAAARRGEIERITQILGEAAAADRKAADAVSARAKAMVDAGKPVVEQVKTLADLREELIGLVAQEQLLADAQKGGTAATQEETKASAGRQNRIEEINQALAKQIVVERQAAEGVKARAQAMIDAGQPVVEQVQTLQDHQQRLVALTAAENEHQAAIDAGKNIQEEDVDAAIARREEITKITDILARQRAAEAGAAEAVKKRTQELQAADAPTKAHAKSTSELKEELEQLSRVEVDLQERTRKGTILNEDDTQNSTKRQGRIKEIAGELARQKAAQDSANQAIKDSSEKLGINNAALDDAKSKVVDMVAQWGSFTAIAGVVVSAFHSILDASSKAYENVAKLGMGVKALATNIGGDRADQIVSQITDIAFKESLGPDARGELINFAGGYTDLNPNATNDEIVGTIAKAAQFKRATGVGGDSALKLVDTFQKRLKTTDGQSISQDQAFQAATTMLTSGFNPENLNSIAQKVGDRGGMDFMAMLLAARQTGLDPEAVSKAIPGMLDALSRTENGRVAKPLRNAGITSDMTTMQRLQTLFEAQKSGIITQSQFEEAMGGAASSQVAEPLRRALSSGGVSEAQIALANSNAVQEAIERQNQSQSVGTFNDQQRNQLRRQKASEESDLSGVGKMMDDKSADLAEVGGGSATVGAFRSTLGPIGQIGNGRGGFFGPKRLFGPSMEEMENPNITINNTTTVNNINPINYGGSPPHQDSGRRDEGRF